MFSIILGITVYIMSHCSRAAGNPNLRQVKLTAMDSCLNRLLLDSDNTHKTMQHKELDYTVDRTPDRIMDRTMKTLGKNNLRAAEDRAAVYIESKIEAHTYPGRDKRTLIH